MSAIVALKFKVRYFFTLSMNYCIMGKSLKAGMMNCKNISNLSTNEILEVLFVSLTEISWANKYDDILSLLARMCETFTNAQRCNVWVVSDDRDTMWTKAADGIDIIEIPIDSSVVGSCVTNREKIIIDDVYQDNRFNPELEKKRAYKTKSVMATPLYDHKKIVIGAFEVINHEGESDFFDEKDMERLSLVSSYGAEVLIAAKHANEIEQMQKEMVLAIDEMAESHLKERVNHLKRVAEYSKLLALAYGLSSEDAQLLKQASPMYDIGKVAIPEHILNKPGRFDEEERYIMSKHPELGFKTIKNSNRPLLKAAAIVAYEHHEKWDGSGYPNAKSGEEIHIFGRITALADVFDALGSDRVYKKAWSDEKIFSFLQEEKGKHFEPKLIELFFENLDAILAVRSQFKDADNKHYQESKKKNRVKVLGAYGTRSKGCGTSCTYLNSKNVIDAGNLLAPLDAECINLENIWITHAHLDHIVDIASLIDNYFSLRAKPLTLLGLPKTLQAIQKNFLNDEIWPDFSKIKLHNSTEMAIVYKEIELDVVYKLSETETIRAIKSDHTVESCGFIYTCGFDAVLITQDTFSLENIIDEINHNSSIKAVAIECSFTNEMKELAIASKHLTPELLFSQLKHLKRDDIKLYINHIKPSYFTKICDEIEEEKGKWEPIILKDGDYINF